MTLEEILIERIRATGPMRLSDYMAECLLHPNYGYYASQDPLGQSGDFITAPEITQMYGELLGLSLAQSWVAQGRPQRFALAEAGPGRGTLMADALRATKIIPGFHDALDLHLIEASPALRAKQKEILGTATWHETVQTLPELPLYLIASEFFDALPIRQFLREGDAWSERLVGLSESGLCYGLGPASGQPTLDHRLEDTEQGTIIELCPALPPIVQEIGARIETHGGAALIVDYGDWRSQGDTFQAVRGHEEADPLQAPGSADLTAHVDFEAICAAAPSAFSRVTPQGVFLERLGITKRAQDLAKMMDPVALERHILAHRRLTHPDEMGSLFKVVALFPNGAPPPPGVET